MIIGFCGPIGAGKTTCARHLEASHGFRRVRFAGPLKDMLRALGLTDEELDGHLKEQPCDLLGGQTPRRAMQTLGTEWGRALIHPDLWVLAWLHAIKDYPQVVVDDVRFPNEVETIRAAGGMVILVERPGFTAETTHPSESHRLRFDFTVRNDVPLETLHERVDQMLELLDDPA